MTDIWKMKHQIDKDRREFEREAMKDYDRDVYYPARKKLVEECRTVVGHVVGSYHDNGLGWTFLYCSKCGAVMKKFGPDDKVLIEGIDF